ncbi:hypothetical protein Acsp03_67190 [Actinomadura sp. NBRC 104412]|uniref:hypothetical protein n=1 Tax=Actinomadura sp. NBRC 104412 TaxID=3032203 RepID=UPI0024A16AB8|nr:hypothetical protein [Actinomadura sp. NBRC 104412]GLZ09253.1 hypothetical protein Acsp03_67190 [Actinomadura sp. NBRC 104412]
MSYVLHGVVGDFDLLRSLSDDVPRAVVAPLRQRLGLVPVTGEICDELTDTQGQNKPFTLMSPAFAKRLQDWSRSGRLAYVEADFWGGEGSQAAALWENGRPKWGPEYAWCPGPPRQDWPINAVLARLGAVRTSALDLFDTVGFGRERDMEGWRWAGLRALDAADYDEWEAACRAKKEADARAATERDQYIRRDDVPVVLDGRAVMQVLDIPPSPMVGAAIRHLQEVYLEHGPLTRDEAATELRRWAPSFRSVR